MTTNYNGGSRVALPKRLACVSVFAAAALFGSGIAATAATESGESVVPLHSEVDDLVGMRVEDLPSDGVLLDGAEPASSEMPPSGDASVVPLNDEVDALVGMRVDDLPSEGELISAPAVDDPTDPGFTIAARFERWMSAEFQASLQGPKWYYSGGKIHASFNADNCTSGYPHVRITLIRTVAGITTNSWPVAFACAGGSHPYDWGSHTAGTYHLYFSRTGPPGIDENIKRVEGWINYNT